MVTTNTNNGVLTANQRIVLGAIIQGHRTGREIAASLNVGKVREQDRKSRQGVAQTAAALIRKGWVERVRVRGIVHYRATPAGREKFRKTRSAREAAAITRATVAQYQADREAARCRACRPGSTVIAHTCGLRELQDMLSIPVQGRYAGPPRCRCAIPVHYDGKSTCLTCKLPIG